MKQINLEGIHVITSIRFQKCIFRRLGRSLALSVLTLVVAALSATCAIADEPPRPNVVILFADDLGYGDLGCYGATGYETPHLDQLAADGMPFTDFYVSAAGCSPSRVSLLTGCYPLRAGGGGGSAYSQSGLSPDEITLAEVLRDAGYRTACFGKWHLGWSPDMLPTGQGFDQYFGLPYSIDMWPFHPQRPDTYPDLPLMRDTEVVALNSDPRLLTRQYTEEAVKFIRQNRQSRFFLYLPYSLPHVPLFASKKFQDTTERGLYGDVISEIDWSAGQIVAALKSAGIHQKTLVIFSSDNGPWLSYGTHGGSAGPLREGKGTTFEGGMREPGIMCWPGKIPAGSVCSEVAATIDLLPTIAKLAGTRPPTDRIIDGKDIWPLMSGQPGAKSPHEAYCYYGGRDLQAIRSGRWKLHFPHAYRSQDLTNIPTDGTPVEYVFPRIGQSLFDLENDIGETTNVADEHPEVVKRLTKLADEFREDLGDGATNHPGKNIRPPGRR